MSQFWYYLTYVICGILLFATVKRLIIYFRTPSPLKVPLTPAPTSLGGAILRVLKEVFLFRSLFKGDKALWFGSFTFHLAFLLVILRHLRYFFYPVPDWVMALQTPGIYAAYLLPIPLIYLFFRRVVIDRVRYISAPVDYLILLHILAIGVTGILMKDIYRQNIVDIKAFILGVMTLQPEVFDSSSLFALHFALVLLLVLYFPFSKLIHSWGVIFTPSRNQVDNTREVRHVNPWAN